MIEYIVPSNIDDRVLVRAAKMLEAGALIALPTDTSWSIVCSLKSSEGIKKLRRLSGERDERHFTLLCSSISQFVEVCNLDNTRYRLINRLSPGPYVFILQTLPGTEKVLDIRRHEVGVRIPEYPVPIRLIQTIGHPLYSITAKKSMAGIDEEEVTPSEEHVTELPPIPEDNLFESGWELEGISGVDMILDSGEERARIFSTILDLCGDEIKLIRQGAGKWPDR
ncbi:MAG: L-threonylcarbamoyladenylate synthase [Treponema sp.]|jgi:tRNA threonylcarbamoyl adenosine modification protein (Sua5/YciO/YrdC/YwlC family)|nr:L-threonylcarbamoyladenylate synthase [Treponema sp.]